MGHQLGQLLSGDLALGDAVRQLREERGRGKQREGQVRGRGKQREGQVREGGWASSGRGREGKGDGQAAGGAGRGAWGLMHLDNYTYRGDCCSTGWSRS